MKVSKTFSLDLEIVQELNKIKNQSLLINSYLKHYFSLDNKQEVDNVQSVEDDFKEVGI